MKKFFLACIFVYCFQFIYAQKPVIITLTNEQVTVSNRKFYIDTVIDNRYDKSIIGVVQTGAFNLSKPAIFPSSLPNTLQKYFNYALPPENAQIPITVKINKLEIYEKTTLASEYGFVDVLIEFYYKNTFLYKSEQHLQKQSIDVTGLHEENIRTALKNSLFEFSNSQWITKIDGYVETPDSSKQVQQIQPTYSDPYKPVYTNKDIEKMDRNVNVIGYQIGGLALIGFEHEYRINDYFGLNLGFGLRGYTAGIKIHTTPSKNSAFFNCNYKDGGFGLIKIAGIDYGGRIPFSKNSEIAFQPHIGLAKILDINESFANVLYKGKQIPDFTFNIGLGISW